MSTKSADLGLKVGRLSGQAPGPVLRDFHVFLICIIGFSVFFKESLLKQVIEVNNHFLIVM